MNEEEVPLRKPKDPSKALKDHNLAEECDPRDTNYKGCPWFFEVSQKEEIPKEKDESFRCFDMQHVYEMEGTTPQDDVSHIIEGEGDQGRSTRPQTRDVKMQGNWIDNNRESAASKGRPMTGKSEYRSKRKVRG